MIANENAALILEGESLLRRLFEIATTRLRKREITLHYESSVIDWLLEQSAWLDSLNPLLSLRGIWDRQIGSTLEELLLADSLTKNSAVFIHPEGHSSSLALTFDITPPPKTISA